MTKPTKRESKAPLGVLILAAGEGTRMESTLPKVLHPVSGLPMLLHVIRTANALKPNGIGVVLGHAHEEVQKAVEPALKDLGITRPVQFFRQKDQKGSGHAVDAAQAFVKRFERVLILCGDAPLVTFDTLFSMLRFSAEQKCQMTVLTAKLANPKGYGRIVRTPNGDLARIIEESEASPKELAINEINSGVILSDAEPLLAALKKLSPKGPKSEYFLTDAVEGVRAEGGRVLAFASSNPEEVLGVNTRIQLATIERISNRRILERLMLSGVSVADPAHTYVDATVEVAPEAVLLPGTVLKGRTQIGRGTKVGPFSYVEDSQIGPQCDVRMSHVAGARLLEKTTVGPFSNIRPDSVIGPRAKIGNFSEIKASRIGFGSKVPHLAYVGDAEIAEEVNVGAGAITCNYDGQEKHKTIIGARAFVGSNVNLIAPVKIGKNAKIGAGSTITEDVPEGALAIARARQENKEPKK